MTHGLTHIHSILQDAFRRPAGWIVFSCILTGCTELTPMEYSQFENFDSSGIPQGWVGEYNPFPADSLNIGKGVYDVVMTVRFNTRARSRNLIVDVEQFSLSMPEPSSQREEIILFSNEGKPLGKGNLALYEINDTIRRGVRVDEGYTVTLTTPLSPAETAGINAIGVSLVRSGAKSPFYIKELL